MKASEFNKKAQFALLLLLTLGASLTLGLLSMSGFIAVVPMVSLGLASFALSVMFEGEIYFANLRDALKRLIQKDHHRLEHSKRFLKLILKQTPEEDLPNFLKEYKKLKQRQKGCSHQSSKADKAAQKQLELMERYFMKALFETDKIDKSPLYLQLQEFLENAKVIENDEVLDTKTLIEQTAFRNKWTNRAFYLSLLTGGFFGFGTLFLLAEAVTILAVPASVVAFLPYLLIPLCALSAMAYGLLIYNTMANIIQNDSINQWIKEIKEDFSKKPSFSSVMRGFAAVVLISMGLALTIFTAGTWWTVANNVPKVFPFLKKVPKVITQVLVPLFTSIGALAFNVENTRESMAGLRPKKKVLQKKKASQERSSFLDNLKNDFKNEILEPLKALRKQETLLQFCNPFRLILLLIESPLKVLAFIGHNISIGATTDQIPFVSKWVAMAMGAASELFEDVHYFQDILDFLKRIGNVFGNCLGALLCSFSFKPVKKTDSAKQEEPIEECEEVEESDDEDAHNDECNHTHNIPGMVIKTILSPLFFLSAGWNSLFSQDSFMTSWHKSWNQRWLKEKEPDNQCCSVQSDNLFIPDIQQTLANRKQVSLALANMQLKEQCQAYQSVPDKLDVLQTLEKSLNSKEQQKPFVRRLDQALDENNQANLTILKRHRSRFFKPHTTSSEDFVHELKDTLNFAKVVK